MENIQKINQKKEEYEKKQDEFKNKANQINSLIKEQNKKITEYRNYLNEIFQFLAQIRENVNIPGYNNNNNINNEININLNEMNKIFENTSMSLFELDDALFEIKIISTKMLKIY